LIELWSPVAVAVFSLCYLGYLLFGSERLTEANQGNEEEIPAPAKFLLKTRDGEGMRRKGVGRASAVMVPDARKRVLGSWYFTKKEAGGSA
jgi:hypothetical protein